MSFKYLLLFTLCFYSTSSVVAQSFFFDKSGKSTSEDQAYFQRKLTIAPDTYESRYLSGDQIYFEGRITSASTSNENENTYAGKCVWYFRNGEKKFEKTYSEEGKLNGTAISYYDSGNIWREENFANDKLIGNTFSEYNEDGSGWLIYKDNFDNNLSDWDVYVSSESEAKIELGKFVIKTKTAAGTSRYISVPNSSTEFVVEAKIDISKVKSGQQAGLLFGFKDWENYSFFSVFNGRYSIGRVYEGIISYRAENYLSSAITLKGFNTLKILAGPEKFFYSINGSVLTDWKSYSMPGSKCGFIVSGKDSQITVDDLIYKQLIGGQTKTDKTDSQVKATGSGVVVTNDGYIITNHHVIEGAKSLQVEIKKDGAFKTYNAKLVVADEDNDLALLKIEDAEYAPYSDISFFVKPSGGIEVGTSVFTLGYPLALSGMGKDVKFSDGKVSAKTGYKNATNSFQTTIGVQPGNSGGPIFNLQGELVGIINATVENTDNVSYGIKCSSIFGLLDLTNNPPILPQSTVLRDKTLEDQIKALTGYVVLIKVK